ncbi:hypothetical protein [Halomicrobium katesii]|uniref:hypothetical protein n=1 Tax=Halomicrobium katesii TaxID=437163 RepID=UPI00036F58B1|nr:hypothetical protein [Halomicrobium katesii]
MNRGAVLIAVLLVSSAIAPAGLAQTATSTQTDTPTDTTDKQTYTFQGADPIAVVDTTNMSGSVTVTWSTRGTPGSGRTILARETVDTTQSDGLGFHNSVYEELNATVEGEGAGDVETAVYGGRTLVPDRYDVTGGTGNDKDLTCDYVQKLGRLLSTDYTQYDCTAPVSSNSINTTNTDAKQIKQDIYQRALDQQASAEVTHTFAANRLEGAKTQARIAGQNAQIRALNNGSSKAATRAAGKQAIADHYAKIQINLAKQWDISIANVRHHRRVVDNESGISASYIHHVDETNYGAWETPATHDGYSQISMQLVNGSSVTVTGIDVSGSFGGGDAFDTTLGLNRYEIAFEKYYRFHGFEVGAPTDSHDPHLVHDNSQYVESWQQIKTQNDAVQSDMDVLVNNTYDSYQAGEINNSDLIDPYLYGQEFSAGDNYQGWAASKLTMMGANSPETLDSTGYMVVTTEDGSEYRGVLMSQTNPASGQFETNMTYDPSAIGGTQWVVTDERTVELTTNFSISEIRTTDGERRQNVTIEKTVYKTADVNTTQLAQLYENLAYERAQWEAREQELGGGGGGGFLGGGSINQTVALLALAALAGAALLGNS